jgi:hypothetical protein
LKRSPKDRKQVKHCINLIESPLMTELDRIRTEQYWEAIAACASVEEVLAWLGLADEHAELRRHDPEYAAICEAAIQWHLDRKKPH